ncbi:MAG TPA: histone deacetylase, partial [Gaiellaceae bacterium]|nr:histone deacetylase [Gaiellaceae bacterium]
MRVFAHDTHVYPLPDGHRFPLEKYALLRERIENDTRLSVTDAAAVTWDELERAHDPSYLAKVRAGGLSEREQRALGLPWSPALVERARRSTGATIAAARAALVDGRAGNLGGGTHHAAASAGRGFCLFNDVVVALRVLRGEGLLRRALVVDLDVHQGDGTHALLAADPDAFTVSVNGLANYPYRRVAGDLELDFRDGTTDEPYLEGVELVLAEALRRFRPEIAFYLGGA